MYSYHQVYDHLYEAMCDDPDAFERPSWWREVTDPPQVGSRHHLIVKSKL